MAYSSRHFPSTIPGPVKRTPIGRFQQMLKFGTDSIAMASQMFQEYGPIAALVKGGGTRLMSPRKDCPGSVLVYGPELLREVSTNHEVFHKFHLSGRLHPLGNSSPRVAALKTFGGGLFGVNGDVHRTHRKAMAPAFYPAQVNTYSDDMIAMTERIVSRWEVGQVINVGHEMQELAKQVASLCLFGEDLDESPMAMVQAVQDALYQVTSPWTRFLPYDLPGFPYRKLLASAEQNRSNMADVIARRREKGTVGHDSLSLLIQAFDAGIMGEMSEDDLIGHVSVLFAAGHETSANALSWTMFLLSQHPEVTTSLVDELDGHLKGRAATPDDFESLPYLDNVVKESLRIITPVPWNGRIVSQETELGGHVLPAGTEVMASLYHTQHMADLFPEPEHFDPRRWETITPSPYAYCPFSSGPRICIGAGFAIQEIKIALSVMLQRFRFEFIHPQPINRRGTIVLFPVGGLSLALRPLDGNYQAGVGGVQGNVREMVNLSD